MRGLVLLICPGMECWANIFSKFWSESSHLATRRGIRERYWVTRKMQCNALPNIANISCCKILVKFAQMQKVITSNLHLGQVENEVDGASLSSQNMSEMSQPTRASAQRDDEIVGITQSCQVLLNSWLLSNIPSCARGKYSEKCSTKKWSHRRFGIWAVCCDGAHYMRRVIWMSG